MNSRWIGILLCVVLLAAVCTVAVAEPLTLPDGLTCIDAQAFENAIGIDEVVIGSNVRRIESRAFANSSVRLVIFPETSALEYIAPDAFEGTVGVQFAPGGSTVALAYIGTAGITAYGSGSAVPDAESYDQRITLPIIPF